MTIISRHIIIIHTYLHCNLSVSLNSIAVAVVKLVLAEDHFPLPNTWRNRTRTTCKVDRLMLFSLCSLNLSTTACITHPHLSRSLGEENGWVANSVDQHRECGICFILIYTLFRLSSSPTGAISRTHLNLLLYQVIRRIVGGNRFTVYTYLNIVHCVGETDPRLLLELSLISLRNRTPTNGGCYKMDRFLRGSWYRFVVMLRGI